MTLFQQAHGTRRISKVQLLSFIVCFQALSVAVQAGTMHGINGIIEGRVLDAETKEQLAGVNIVVVGTSFGAATDAEGYYQINNVRAGVYDVRYSIIGYKNLVMKNVTVLPDLRTRIDVELEETSIELETIEIRAERPLIQKDQAATTFSIGDIKIEKLPVSKFQDVLSLQPGTTMEGNVRGGKANEVTFLIDGLPVQDVIGGGLGSSLPRSSISGVTIHTGGFEAEYGNALSGVVNVVTKSGDNRHSVVVRYERDDWIPGSWNRQIDHSSELEITGGGPIKEGEFYYFTANTFSFTDTRWWQDFHRFFYSPISEDYSGFSKLEYHLSPGIRIGLQGIYSIRSWRDYEFSWRFNLDGLPPRKRESYRVALVLSHTLSESAYYTLNVSRFSLLSRIGEGRKESITLEPYEYDFFLRYIVDGKRNWWAKTQQQVYTAKGDFTALVARMHLFKIGFELNQFDIGSDLVKYEPQTTYFGKPIVEAPLLNYSNSYNYHPRSGSIYVQDKMEVVRDGSNISVGLRWDFLDPTAERPLVEYVPIRQEEYTEQVVGRVKARFKHQLSPRVAAAFPVGGTSFFFVNFGHYFQFPLFDYLYSGINPVQLRQGARNVLTGNPDLEPERTIAWETGFKHGITNDVVGSVTYFRKSFKNQIDAKTLIPFDSKHSGDYGFASYVNNAEANASGIEVVLDRQRNERISGTISYTYMVTEGISEYVGQRINYAQWGFPMPARPFPLSWDQRHTIKVDAESKIIGDIQANVVVLYNSARPYTYYPTRDGFTTSDPNKVLLPNNRRMEDVLFTHMKLSRRIPLGVGGRFAATVFVDIRNLLNKKNVRWIDSSGRIGGELGDPGAYYDPRRVRFGLRVDF